MKNAGLSWAVGGLAALVISVVCKGAWMRLLGSQKIALCAVALLLWANQTARAQG